jgi:hypothetical protein
MLSRTFAAFLFQSTFSDITFFVRNISKLCVYNYHFIIVQFHKNKTSCEITIRDSWNQLTSAVREAIVSSFTARASSTNDILQTRTLPTKHLASITAWSTRVTLAREAAVVVECWKREHRVGAEHVGIFCHVKVIFGTVFNKVVCTVDRFAACQ